MEQPSPISETTPPTMSLGARLLNVFAVPGDVFEHVKLSPVSHANWLVPALAFILVGCIGAWVIFSQDSIKAQLSDMTEKAIQKQVEKGKISKQQAESGQQAGEKMAGVIGAISAVVITVLVAVLTPFWGGLIIWLAGSKILKGNFPYMKGVEVAGLAGTIAILGEVIRILLVVMLGNLYASPSPVMLVKNIDPQSPVFAVLAVFNLFLFWELGVRSVGLARLSGASFGKAAIWVFGAWALVMGSFIGLGQALRIAFGG